MKNTVLTIWGNRGASTHCNRRLINVCSIISVASCLIFALSGCTIRLGDFTVISSKNVKIPTVAKGPRVKGEDCVMVILFPWGIPNMEEATDKAIQSAGPEYDALVDSVLYYVNNSFIIGQVCYKVEGTPINTKASVSMREGSVKHVMYHSSRYVSRSE